MKSLSFNNVKIGWVSESAQIVICWYDSIRKADFKKCMKVPRQMVKTISSYAMYGSKFAGLSKRKMKVNKRIAAQKVDETLLTFEKMDAGDKDRRIHKTSPFQMG